MENMTLNANDGISSRIRNGSPQIREFKAKAAPAHLQSEFDLLNEFQFTKAYSWTLGIIKDRLRVRKLVNS